MRKTLLKYSQFTFKRDQKQSKVLCKGDMDLIRELNINYLCMHTVYKLQLKLPVLLFRVHINIKHILSFNMLKMPIKKVARCFSEKHLHVKNSDLSFLLYAE